ncbi:S-methyl-5'-thioadenosine phosphorylase [Caldinitratiruptor microaerophilus]|uniref:Probable 6-oxopurine nucleoside phosphorylase n=1 Tax=Caldinitratiruptor microaerophilus TaxID=671077 RepID=A0AA35G7G7_9FIRM|nr:S-methyl-5'-thioadenosine phosphorylase [Caldinitratiruptor microaerophilus]BDG60081.1 putative 6-oxopurine nucleoside phosphorylase [Caldinitratiruptor microaerophilus]
MVRYALIGGTGVYDPAILTGLREEQVSTPYGDVRVKVGTYRGKEVAFLARHGEKHSVPPHRINYRANIWALKRLGVERIIATTAVGSLNLDMRPGDFVFCDQFLDFTKGRPSTFFEGGPEGVVHVDFTEPYCPELRGVLAEAAKTLGLGFHREGTYVCTEGPRFETPAEIKAYQRLGGDVVGMTGVPEVVLAHEAGICYSTVSMVTNFAAGISPQPLTHEEVLEVMAQNAERLRRLAMLALDNLPEERGCRCAHASPGIRM